MERPRNRRLPDRALIAGRQLPRLAHGFVIVAVIGLAIAPAVVVQHMVDLQSEIGSVVQPAQDLGAELRVAYERQVAERRGFHLARLQGEEQVAQRAYGSYRDARAEEVALYAELEPLMRQISTTAAARLDSLGHISRTWHEMEDALLAGRITLGEYTQRLPQQRELQDSVYAMLERTQGEIERIRAETVAAADTSIRRDRALALGLGMVALLAALGVAWSARREHLLARALAHSVEDEMRIRSESERRREELEHVTESRTRLIRGFSHDVKNPLGAADGYLQLLEDGVMNELAPKQREGVGRARRLIGNALGLIEDLLELARAETGQMTVELVGVDIGRIARETADQFRALAEAKGLDIRTNTPQGPVHVVTDAARTRQILGNLLSNAVKYTSEGMVSVDVQRRENGAVPAPGEWVAVDVADTGHGIPDDKRRFLFQEFTRLDPDSGHGAGIGLAISRHIAHALGGDITLESRVGQGSTFTLWLPLDSAAAHSAREAQP